MGTATASSNVVLPRHPHAREFPVRRGDTVTALDGESLGMVLAVQEEAFEVLLQHRHAWLSRDDVFWADAQGVMVAFGIDELADHLVEAPQTET